MPSSDTETDVALADKSNRVNSLKHSLLVAKEVRIIKGILSNDLRVRRTQLKKLHKWISWRSTQKRFKFSDHDFTRIWNGLFYYVWMSDKPLPQEEACENISSLLSDFSCSSMSIHFFSSFLQTMCSKWFGIDQWRMDKFLMLFRRMLRTMFRVLLTDNGKSENIKEFNIHILLFILSETSPNGLVMHFFDIFLEEFAKVSKGTNSTETLNELLQPFFKYIENKDDLKMVKYCCNRIFSHLIFHIKMGTECLEDNTGEKDQHLEDLDSNTPTEAIPTNDNEDPRAACIDAVVSILQVDTEYIINRFEEYLANYVKNNKRYRKIVENLLNKYVSIQSDFHSQLSRTSSERTKSSKNRKRMIHFNRRKVKGQKRKNSALNPEAGDKSVQRKRLKKRSLGVWLEKEIK